MADPWAQFATVGDDEFAQFEQEQGPLSDADYRTELMRLVNARAPRADINALIQRQGIDPNDPAQVAGLDEAIKAVAQGRQAEVVGMEPQAGGESVGQALYRGAGSVAAGVGDLFGLVANPLNILVNTTGLPQALTGQPLTEDLGESFRDMTGAPAPVTSGERLQDIVTRAGTSALTGAGVARLAAGLPGMAGYVAGEVAGNPTRDVIAATTGSVGGEYGGDAGEAVGGAPGRVAGTLLGSVAGGAAGLKASEAAAARIASRVPESVIFDAQGGVTPDGHEMLLRAGTSEAEVRQVYARRRGVEDRRPREERQAAREAFRNRPPGTGVVPPDLQPGPTAEMPQRVGNLDARTNAVVDGIQQRIDSGQAFDRPNAPPPPPRDLYTEAGEEGIRLTRGQAEQDFSVQNDENSLRVSATPEGEQARQFYQQQQREIAGAVDRLRARFGPDAGTAANRGEQVQQAVRDLRDAGAEGVRRLYREAESLGGDGLTLDTDGIHNAAVDVLIDEAVPEGTKRAISQELARYGIIGTAEPTNEVGLTRVALEDGSSITFRGPPKQLTASNAEELRQAINRLYDPTKPSLSGQSIKPAIDDALEQALERAANDGEGRIGAAYQNARSAYQQQKRTFAAKDIIDSLTANKKGTETPVLMPERAIAQVIGSGKDGVTNLRRVRGLLQGSATDTSRQAWAAIQHQALADIFDAAWSRNVNHGNGQIGDVISGAKLNSAIETFGIDKLRLVLSPEDFNGLMKLRRIIGAATIPISGTTNPSGTATKIINYMKAGTLRFAGAIPGIGTLANATVGAAAKGKEIAATRRTLRGITSYTGPASAQRMDQAARDFVAEYIRSGKSGEFVPSAINLSATQGGVRND